MKRLLLAMGCVFGIILTGFTQTVKNVQAHVEGNKVYINYDLISSTEGQKFTIELKSSIDNFVKPLQQVTGDVGDDQEAGLGKTIIWNAISEQGNFSGTVTFEVTSLLTFSPLNITSPTAKSSAKIGKALNVQWTGGDRGRNLKMAILQGSNTITEIPNVGSSGNYTWEVPKSTPKGSNYQVKLFDPTKPKDAAMSAEFKLKKTSVLVYVLPGVALVGAAAVILLSGDNGTGGTGPCNVCDPTCKDYNPSDPSCGSDDPTELPLPPALPGGGD